ncbi:MAG: dodecin family protein [Gemmatimonadaceae bacterium]
MAVAKVTEIISSSSKSFDDAIQTGLKRANKTLKGVSGAWVKSMKIEMKNGKVSEYRVAMKVTFVLTD